MANFNFNKVILGGRFTADPELKTTPSGVSVVSFTIAVTRRCKAGEEPKADFINCQAWRNNAEFIAKYFKKASAVCVVGELQVRNWEKDGEKKYSYDVIVDEVSFVDSKSEKSALMTEAPTLEPIEDGEDLPF